MLGIIAIGKANKEVLGIKAIVKAKKELKGWLDKTKRQLAIDFLEKP